MPREVLIAGGGFAGAALAVHLLRGARTALSVTIVEPRAMPGAGLAYGTDDPAHRINVPSDKMTVLADAPGAFTAWLERTGRRRADPEGEDGTGHHYSRRADFGAFMADLLAEAAAAAPPGSRYTHLRDRVTALRPTGLRAEATLAGGRRLTADRAVLAISHDRPVLPMQVAPGILAHPGYHGDPWATGRLAAIAPEARVVVLGTGLTMVDVVTGLFARGHRGPVLAVSRRGLLPQGHGAFAPVAPLPPGGLPPGARAGLRLAREMVARERAAGRDWHLAVEGLRRAAEPIWQGWPAAEQARALRRLRAVWDVHRFRIAPQLAERLAEARRAGRLTIRAAAVAGLAAPNVGALDAPLRVALRPRGGPPETVAADAVINCLGPCADVTRRDEAVLQGLIAAGHARPDPHRLGLEVDAAHRLRDRSGRPQPALRAVGPLTRGVFWEVVGVPELSAHCARLADALLTEVAAPDAVARA